MGSHAHPHFTGQICVKLYFNWLLLVLNFPTIVHNQDPLLHDTLSLWPYNDSFRLFEQTHFEDSHEESSSETPNSIQRGVPTFDNNQITNISAQLGETAFLHCRVRNIGQLPVSWVRRRDWHILTSGLSTYTNDDRFQVVHQPDADEWTLAIKYVQKRDNGTYECQVATGAGTISHYFNLHVVVPAAFILGSGEYHIGEGSTISLVCIIENSPVPPQEVFWYHNDQLISYESTRAGVTMTTEPGPKTHSRLLISRATRGDSGNYTCQAPNTESDTIYVFVSTGDNTAAIQRQESSADSIWASFSEYLVATLLAVLLFNS